MPPAQSNPAWTDALLADPHHVADKRERVQKMFAAIAPTYDLNNRLHSFWLDQAWRRRAVKLATLKADDVVVDVACGTGDLALKFATALRALSPSQYSGRGIKGEGHCAPDSRTTLPPTPSRSTRRGSDSPNQPPQVIGIDFTYEMLPRAAEKSRASHSDIAWLNGDATALPLPDACCDVVSIAFGIRNVQEPERALAEFRRVLRPGGRVIILEFSEPGNPLIRAMNRFYTGKVMPITATLISRDRSGAYKYLPKSIGTFWDRQKMCSMLAAAGFSQITQHPMTFGVCVCYRAIV